MTQNLHGDSSWLRWGGRCQALYLLSCSTLIFSFNWNPGELSDERLNGAISIPASLAADLSIKRRWKPPGPFDELNVWHKGGEGGGGGTSTSCCYHCKYRLGSWTFHPELLHLCVWVLLQPHRTREPPRTSQSDPQSSNQCVVFRSWRTNATITILILTSWELIMKEEKEKMRRGENDWRISH